MRKTYKLSRGLKNDSFELEINKELYHTDLLPEKMTDTRQMHHFVVRNLFH